MTNNGQCKKEYKLKRRREGSLDLSSSLTKTFLQGIYHSLSFDKGLYTVDLEVNYKKSILFLNTEQKSPCTVLYS